jgi:ABC-2 type transport system permease protein
MGYEMGTTIRTRSFLIMAFGLPLLGVLIFVAASLLGPKDVPATEEADGAPEAAELRVEGYVDAAGLIRAIPPEVPANTLVPYPDETAARQALERGEIAAYYLVPADYVETGDLIYVNPDYSWVTGEDQSWTMGRTLFANLLGNDPATIEAAAVPMDLEVIALAPTSTALDDDNPLAFYAPYGAMIVFYFVLIMSASLLLNSVSAEKKNRVMEVLLVAVRPRELLTGKIAGLGLMALVQAGVWLGTGYGLLRVAGEQGSLPAGLEVAPSILVWGLVLFVLSYAVYASLMAGLGALAPNVKEASQAVIVVIWPILIPMFFIVSLIENPHGMLSVVLSLFPLTAPVAMLPRLMAGGVPWWQPGLAAVLLLATAAIVVQATARMFQAQYLLSGQAFDVKRYLRALLAGR